MTAKEAFSLIYSRVKVKENFVPRKYQTIGGMWTVDTYMLGNIIAQSMDEGYTDKIIGEKVVAIRYHTGIIEYMKGDETDLINLVGELHETSSQSL